MIGRTTPGRARAGPARVRAVLELMRVSNLPTVWTNVLVGAAVAAGDGPIPWSAALGAAVAASLCYVGGMVLNDVVDARVDARERPQRPIPSARVSRDGAAWLGVGLLIGAVPVALAAGPGAGLACVALIGAVVAYDLVHKRWPASVLLMGLCRALVYVLGAAAAAWPLERPVPLLSVSLAVLLTTAAFTLIARAEAGGRRPAPASVALALALPLVPLAVLPVIGGAGPLWPLAAGTLMLAWLFRSASLALRGRVMPAVLGWIAGLALVDTWFLTLLGRPGLAAVSIACFALTVLSHRRITGT